MRFQLQLKSQDPSKDVLPIQTISTLQTKDQGKGPKGGRKPPPLGLQAPQSQGPVNPPPEQNICRERLAQASHAGLSVMPHIPTKGAGKEQGNTPRLGQTDRQEDDN